MTTTTFRPATDRQFAFLKRLVAERQIDALTEAVLTRSREKAIAGTLSSKEASSLIDGMLQLPKAEQAAAAAPAPQEVPEGMHVLHGTTYKVQVAKNGSGRRYAKALEQHDGRWTFVYAPGVIRDLSEATRMSAEQASEFGALYGICCNCGRDLTDERSIHFGYGPVCAANNGWPYGAVEAPAPVSERDPEEVMEALHEGRIEALQEQAAYAAEEGLCLGCEESDGEVHDSADHLHESPCVCGPYDRCRKVREQDAQRSGNWRDRFRAYND